MTGKAGWPKGKPRGPAKKRERKTPTIKVCYECGTAKEAGAFYTNPQNRDGLSSYCRACTKQTATQRREDQRRRLEYAEKVTAARGTMAACDKCKFSQTCTREVTKREGDHLVAYRVPFCGLFRPAL